VMSSLQSIATQPWASGPAEILQHGLSLLQQDSDVNRRLAMLSIDNAVELMMKTYLGLPRRATGISIGRDEFEKICKSFPRLLDAIEKYAGDKLNGVRLEDVEWYHRLRNELYHEGNGLTVVRDKVVIYADVAKLLFRNLFGFELPVRKIADEDLILDFLNGFAALEQTIKAFRDQIAPRPKGWIRDENGHPVRGPRGGEKFDRDWDSKGNQIVYEKTEHGSNRSAEHYDPDEGEFHRKDRDDSLGEADDIYEQASPTVTIPPAVRSQIERLQTVRNEVVYGAADSTNAIRPELIQEVQELTAVLQRQLNPTR